MTTTTQITSGASALLTGSMNGTLDLDDYVGEEGWANFDMHSVNTEYLDQVKAILGQHCPGWTLLGEFIFAEVGAGEVDDSVLEAIREEIEDIDVVGILGAHEK